MRNAIDISTNLKISLTLSMKSQIESFVNKHNGYVGIYRTEENLIDSIYFYWLRNSSRKNYKWLQQKNIHIFLKNNTPLLKIRLKILLNEMYF